MPQKATLGREFGRRKSCHFETKPKQQKHVTSVATPTDVIKWKSEMSNTKLSNKHRYSISGRESSDKKSKKRQRSSEEIKERKKGKHQTDICETGSDSSDTTDS